MFTWIHGNLGYLAPPAVARRPRCVACARALSIPLSRHTSITERHMCHIQHIPVPGRPRPLGMLEAAYRVPAPTALGDPGTAHTHTQFLYPSFTGTVPRVFRRGSLACSRSSGTAAPSSLGVLAFKECRKLAHSVFVFPLSGRCSDLPPGAVARTSPQRGE